MTGPRPAQDLTCATLNRMRLVPLIALLSILEGCANHSTPPVRLAIGGQSQLVYLPATLAEQLKLYESEGVHVTLIDSQAGAKSLEALLGGSVDVVCGYFDHVIQMNAQGRNLKAFVALQRFPGLALVVSPATKRKIDSIASLKGAIIGVSSPGSSTDLLVRYLLSRNGVAPADVSFTGIGMAAGAVAAMEHGKVDAAVMAEPAISLLARRAGMLHVLADTRNEEGVRQVFGVEHYPAAVFYSTGEWLAANPQAAAAMARAMQKTLVYLQTTPQDAAAKMPAAFQGDDPGLYAQAVQRALPMYSKDGRMPQDGPELVKSVLSVSIEQVRGFKIDPAASFTNQWLKE